MSVVQIAAQAGVSIATVSRVLNNSRRVNPRLADQVHRAMQQLNFTPSQIRRRASNKRPEDGRALTIAIIAVGRRYRDWFEMPVIASVVAAITRSAMDQNASTLITDLPNPADISTIFRRQPVDGALMFLDSNISATAFSQLCGPLPVVRVMGGQMSPLQFDHVAPDNPAIGYLACQTLMAQGCRDLAYLTTRPAWDFSMLRGQGFAAAALAAGHRPHVFLEGAGLEVDCVYGANAVAADDLPQLVARVAEMIRTRDRSTPFGLFVSRDEETVQVYRMLGEHGIVPGRDLTIVSCDNEQVRLAGLSPRPLSIDLNVAEIAHHAVCRLLDVIKRTDSPPVRMLINPKLPSASDRRSDDAAPAHNGDKINGGPINGDAISGTPHA